MHRPSSDNTPVVAKAPGLRKRVERLLRGEVHSEDLTRLFVTLRFHTFGLSTVKEIGHFIGHGESRHTGLVTDRARSMFRFLAAIMPYSFGTIPGPIDLAKLPPDFPKLLTE